MAGKLLNLPRPEWKRPSWCRHSELEFKGFHICIDLSRPEHPSAAKIIKVFNERHGKGGGAGHNKGMTMSEEQRQQIAETQRARWAKIKKEQAPRDRDIYRARRQGATSKELSEKYGLHVRTIDKICQDQRAAQIAS